LDPGISGDVDSSPDEDHDLSEDMHDDHEAGFDDDD
jgi:hypothetical protein